MPLKIKSLAICLGILPTIVLANANTLTSPLPMDFEIPQIFVESFEEVGKPLPINVLPNVLQQKLILAKLPADSLSMVVQPLSQKKPPLINYFSQTPRVPASTQKLIPTFIALDLLGKDFVWKTKIFKQGFVWNHTLYGDLIIQGSGDPKFLADDLTALFNQVKNAGIHKIKGNIILDNQQFQNVQYDVWAFDGKGLQPYNAAPNGLLINFGTLTIHLQQSLENKQYFVDIVPKLADFTYPQQINETDKPCHKHQFLPKLTNNAIVFKPLPKQLTCDKTAFWFTFPDGNALIKQTVIASWQQIEPKFHGHVIFRYQYPLIANPKWQSWQHWWQMSKIAEHISPTLAEQIVDINQFSNNVMTEQLALSLPLYHGQKTVSDYPSTFAVIQQWWQQHLKTPAPMMTRASGLCRDCFIQPQSLIALLQHAYQHPSFQTFQASLAVAGQSGTMISHGKRFPNSPAIGRAWIKTGTLDDVSAMAGYVLGQSGQWYAVVGIINFPNVNQHAKEILDEMLIWTAKQ